MRISSFYSRLLNKSEGTCAQGKILLDHFAVVRDPPAPVHVSVFIGPSAASNALTSGGVPCLTTQFGFSKSFRSQGD